MTQNERMDAPRRAPASTRTGAPVRRAAAGSVRGSAYVPARHSQTGGARGASQVRRGDGAQARPAASRPVRRAGEEPARKSDARPVSASQPRREAPSGARRPSPSRSKSGSRSALSRPSSSRRKPPMNLNWGTLALDVLFAFGILSLCVLGLRQRSAHADFLEMKQVVDRPTFYEGITVEDVDVSGMTLEAALDYWRDTVEPQYAERTVNFDNGISVTAQRLGYYSDYETVLSNAWYAGRRGSLEQRYQMASNRQVEPVAYTVNRTLYDEATLDQYLQAAAKVAEIPPKDASIKAFNAKTGKFVFNPEEDGATLDVDAMKTAMINALENGGGEVALVFNPVPAAVTQEEVASHYGLIAYATTDASKSNENRMTNIELALSLINGTCVKPGYTFSFNSTVGQRTTARGFMMAKAFSSGEITEQIGGGICQVSTTLCMAAIQSNMSITERHAHSIPVNYAEKGIDATVNWSSQDFKFRNTSSDNVYIIGYVTKDKHVRIGLFGKLLDDGKTISVETKTTKTLKYETEYVVSDQLATGKQNLVTDGRDGYEAEAYKVTKNAAGKEISRELLFKSVYKAKNAVVEYGP